MPSAAKTPNYNLTQYADNGTDKVSFMGDYNADMSKVDKALNENANAIISKEDKTAHTADVTSLNASIALKEDTTAHTADVTSLNTAIATKEDKTAHTADVTSLNTAIATKEDKTAHTADVTSLNTAIGAVNASIQNTNNSIQELSNIAKSPIFATYFMSTDERLYGAQSEDGVNFYKTGLELHGDVYTVRDPSCESWGGGIVACYTRPTISGGGAFGTTNTIGIAKVQNHNFEQISVITDNLSNFARLWAPDFYIEGNTLYIIFSATNDTTNLTFTAYEIHTTSTDLTGANWSSPQPLGDGLNGSWYIDHHIVKDDTGVYHDFFAQEKNAGSDYLQHATATNLHGPWTNLGAYDNQWGQTEGPTTIPLKNGGYRLFIDSGGMQDNNNGGMYYCDCSHDFSSHGSLHRLPYAMRHAGMCVMPTTMSDWGTISAPTAARLSNNGDFVMSFKISPNGPQDLQFNQFDLYGNIHINGNGVTVDEAGMYLVTINAQVRGYDSGAWLSILTKQSGVLLNDRGKSSSSSADVPTTYNIHCSGTLLNLSAGSTLSFCIVGSSRSNAQASCVLQHDYTEICVVKVG